MCVKSMYMEWTSEWDGSLFMGCKCNKQILNMGSFIKNVERSNELIKRDWRGCQRNLDWE